MHGRNTVVPSVTIAASALNEERNIAAWLRSVLTQAEDDFHFEKVLVVSDGSTDATAARARAVGSDLVDVQEHGERIGKSSRLNQIYAALESDILVQSDADVVFAHPFVIRELIQPLLHDPSVAMCGGNPLPVEAQTFVERAVNYTCAAYVPLRWRVRGGDNVFSVDGRLLAYWRSFAKSIHMPHDMIANDAYTYFWCITQGHRYRFVRSAVVHFRSPQTLAEQIRQNTRFTAAPLRMGRSFPDDVVRREYRVPRFLLLRNQTVQFVRHPIACLFIFAVNAYCKLRARVIERTLTALWQVVPTTKRIETE